MGIPLPKSRDPLSDVVCVPRTLLRRVELALLLMTTDYAVKVMPMKMWDEVKQLHKDIQEITNG